MIVLFLLSALLVLWVVRTPWQMTVGLYPFGAALTVGMLLPAIQDHGLAPVAIGAGIVGALYGGWIVPKLGLRRSLLVFGLAQTGCIATFAGAGTTVVTPLVVVFAALAGLTIRALFSAMVRRSSRPPFRSQISTQVSTLLASIATGVGLGWMTAATGPSLFIVPALLTGLGVVVMALPAPRERRRLRTLHLSSGRAITLWEPRIPLLPHYYVLAPTGHESLSPAEQLEFLNMAQLQAAELGNTHHGHHGCFTVLYNGGQARRRPWDHVHILAVPSVAAKRRALLLLFAKRALRACTVSGLGLANAQHRTD